MTVIVCLDNKNGMMFGARRQSKDSVLRDRILNNTMSKRLYMNEYSYKMFSENTENHAICDEDFLSVAGEGDFCFVENTDILPYADKIERIVVYRWNRVYPATMYFSFPAGEWHLERKSEIGGSSHDITEEIYHR